MLLTPTIKADFLFMLFAPTIITVFISVFYSSVKAVNTVLHFLPTCVIIPMSADYPILVIRFERVL